MAVAKMTKVTLITGNEQQERLLLAIQGLQNLEVRDLFAEENNEWVSQFFQTVEKQELQEEEHQRTLRKITEAIQFVEHYGDSRQKAKRLKRKEVTINELEMKHDQEIFEKELTETLQLKEEWEALQEKKRQVTEQEEWLNEWQYLDVQPNTVKHSSVQLLLVELGADTAASFLTEMAQKKLAYVETVYTAEKKVCLAIVAYHSITDQVLESIHHFGGRTVDYPFDRSPKEAYAHVKKEVDQLSERERLLSEQIGRKRYYIEKFQWAEEVFLAKKERERIKQQLIKERYLLVVQGWLSEEERELFEEKISTEFPDQDVYLSFEDPNQAEIQTEIPTKLRNHPLVRPFEMLTEMYSLPKYEEIDPTPWMMPFYFVFFGMMVADIGYGLIMLIGTILAQQLFVLPNGLRRFTDFFKILAIPSILWGFVYSSFFGLALPKTFLGIALPFPLLSTTDDVNTILILSVVFGLIQILVGLFVAGKENIKRKAYLEAISEGFAWQGILVGLLVAVGGVLLLNNSVFTVIGAVLVVLSALSILIIPVIRSHSKAKGFAKGAYSLYGITGYIGDLVSYTRLMAIGISGGSIATAFNMLVAFMPPLARFSVGILLIVALQALNLFLTLLSAYVHGARLQYVEFFGKFYTGGGRAFQPLKTVEKYMNIKEKNKRE